MKPIMTFDADKTVAYWLDGAEYDLETARALIEKRRYPYALFFGHLALEKLLKALVVKTTREHAPLSHDLVKLAARTPVDLTPEMSRDLERISEFNLEARYPEDNKRFYVRCTEQFTRENLDRIEELY
jgi:HEPN domain-containing protein